MKRKHRHLLESLAFGAWMRLCRMLGLDAASALGSWLLKRIGPRLSLHRIARVNLAIAYPEKSEAERENMARGMWAHLGRIAGEFPFLKGDGLIHRVSVEGAEYLPSGGQPVIFMSAHLGQWEMTYPVVHARGISTALIYRHANNPYVEAEIKELRGRHADSMIVKGKKGAIALLRAIREKKSLAMLVDQKMNEGISIPFFGVPAMTAPAIAELSIRYGLPIIPARVIRTRGAHFHGIVSPPLEYAPSGDMEKDVAAIMAKINALLEAWIRETPEQWFWVHKRWSKERYAAN